MGTFELVTGDSDLSVTVTPVGGVFVVALTNQTPVALSDLQLAWFPPDDGEVLTKTAPLVISPMGEVTLLIGYSCPSVGSWRLLVLFRSDDGTETPLMIAHAFIAGDAMPGRWRLAETWRDLTPFLTSTEVALPPGSSPALALQVIGREVASGLVALKGDDTALVSLDPVVLFRFVPPGKVVISGGRGLHVPDAAFLATRLTNAGAIDHHREYFLLGSGVSQLRLFLDLNWYVDETVNVINKIHRILGEFHAPAMLDPLIPMLDKRETLKELTAVERQVFEQTLQKLEQLICPA